MVEYSKRTCKDCGIKMPVPAMFQISRAPLGINGRPLPTRLVWLCKKCHASLEGKLKLEGAHEVRLQTLREASSHKGRDKPPRRRQFTTEELSAMAQEGQAPELMPRSMPPSQLSSVIDADQPAKSALERGNELTTVDWMIIGLMTAFFVAVIFGMIWLVFSGRFTSYLFGAAVFGILLWLFPIGRSS